ncbi:histidinol dehydrogenase [Paenibacillus sp. N1-5-1-14]|uniref:histidinol dehydrogenase n=1 Tax=Paenibacillus radicibacter TaxID=2972488 RepID=UPI0021594E0D|nr:histidinol dehydrogenase [Paenibacillus radicibacter]MCR8643335.1 histidinol dehydrogenase [Paenibacillus radicibacter]
MKIVQASDFSLKREVEYGTPEQNEAVARIIEAVRQDGDEALIRFSREFDRVEIESLRVDAAEIEAAYKQVDAEFVVALRKAAANIRAYHEKQKRNSWMDLQEDGSILGQVIRPLKRVGLYVPGGTAAYPSSVLMNAIPAQVAGVREIVIVTPPATAGSAGVNPHILVAAAEAGITEVYRVGGAQAIAALAYGTASIAAVDKIVGPGNIYVALAKRNVFGVVDIDMIAGPTDIVVLADESADPTYVAADLLAQAEHDVLSPATLLTPSLPLAEAVQAELARQLEVLPRREIAAESTANRGAIVVTATIDEAVRLANAIAPEHIELLVAEPFALLPRIENAGAIFLGQYSSEPVGDYFAGPNHVLPTNGTARFSSPLSVDDFIKKSSVIHYSREALLASGDMIMTLARNEGLEGHARAIEVRLNKEKERLNKERSEGN